MRIFATSKPKAEATDAALAESMDAEVAVGRSFYESGLIVEAFMDTEYRRTYMVLEAPDVDTAKRAFDAYPHVRAGLIEFDFVPLVGMPAVSAVHEARGESYPSWWPTHPSALPLAANARRFFEKALAMGDRLTFDELVAEDVVVNSGIEPLAPIRGREAYWKALGKLAAFTFSSFALEDVIVAGDRTVVRMRAEATHTGDALGLPATQKKIVMWEIHLMRWREGKIVENLVADINYDWPWLVASAYPDGIGKTGR